MTEMTFTPLRVSSQGGTIIRTPDPTVAPLVIAAATFVRGSGGVGASTWDQLDDKPAVIAAGADEAEARAAIGAADATAMADILNDILARLIALEAGSPDPDPSVWMITPDLLITPDTVFRGAA